MTEKELALAYTLAVSSVPTEFLCEEAVFENLFPALATSQHTRAHIGYVASCLRGNEYYDWIEPGVEVCFYYGRELEIGTVHSITKEEGGFFVLIRKQNQTMEKIHISRCRKVY